MIYLNAGNLWTYPYLDKVIEWNEEFKDSIQVKSLFGSIAGLTPTARAVDRLPFRDWTFIDGYVDKARNHDIPIRYTLNQSCIGSIQDFRRDWDTKLRADVRELHDYGVREWTITSPLLIELLRDMFPDDFIEVSTIAEVATAEDATRRMALGANGVNISTSVNRDPKAIRSIVGTEIVVSILANEACLFRCPWRRECYNLSSHNSKRSEELFDFYPFRRCTEVRLQYPVEWIKSRLVLPQWMKVYQEQLGVSWFKVAFRTHPEEVALPILRMYMEQYHGGNLLDLWPTISHLGDTSEPKDVNYISCVKIDSLDFFSFFLEHGRKCTDKECSECGYCQLILSRSYESLRK